MAHLYAVLSLLALSVAAPMATQANVNIGFLGGFSGPVESLTPELFGVAELAVAQINEQGGILDDERLHLVSRDTGCADLTLARESARALIEEHEVAAIVGALCSGATLEAARAATIPADTVMVTPASTSPALTDLEDRDLVFRVSPSDAYQGSVMARLLIKKGIGKVAVTYIDNDYGKGFASALSAEYSKLGGRILLSLPHQESTPDFGPLIRQLRKSGAYTLVVLADAMGSGTLLLRQALDADAFANYVVGDRMATNGLIGAIGANRLQFLLATAPASNAHAQYQLFRGLTLQAGISASGTYAAAAYDSTFLLALALEKSAASGADLRTALREVANAPGESIAPGEWRRARQLIRAGTAINYHGASGEIEFDQNGDVAGHINQVGVSKGRFKVFRRLH